MALKTLLDSDQFGELEESTQGLYKELEDGKYVLDVEGIDEHPTVQSLRNGHKRSKQERDEAKQRAKEFESRFGTLVDAEDLDFSDLDDDGLEKLGKFLKGELELAEPGKAKEIDLDKIKANARKPLEKELNEARERAEKAESTVSNLVVNSALSDAVSEIKVHGPFVTAVKAMFKDKVKVAEGDDGSPVALIEGEYGEQPVGKYLKEWAQTDEGKAFIEAENNSGGGARGGSGSGKINNPWNPEAWSMKEQVRIYNDDPDRAKRMAAEHGKKVGAR